MYGLVITFLIIVISFLLLFIVSIFAERPALDYIPQQPYSYQQMTGGSALGKGGILMFISLMLLILFVLHLFYGASS